MTSDDARLYAARYYNDPGSDTKSFNADFARVNHLGRYLNEEDERYRLILNTIIILSNVFDVKHLTVVLFNIIDSDAHLKLNTYLKYLNINVPEINDYDAGHLVLLEQEI